MDDDEGGPGDLASRRIPWGTLSRESVVAAALSLVRRRGYEQLTIRALAGELGASPMSLYRHVRDKDDLLDEVVDLLIAEAWLPTAPESDWKTFVSDAADGLRALLVREPAVLQVYLRHPVVSPTCWRRSNKGRSLARGERHRPLLGARLARAGASEQIAPVGAGQPARRHLITWLLRTCTFMSGRGGYLPGSSDSTRRHSHGHTFHGRIRSSQHEIGAG
jgi:AcrR family transcriptional regulator